MTIPRGELWTVELRNANFGVIVRDGVVIWSAPYGRRHRGRPWLVFKTLDEAIDLVRKAGGQMWSHDVGLHP